MAEWGEGRRILHSPTVMDKNFGFLSEWERELIECCQQKTCPISCFKRVTNWAQERVSSHHLKDSQKARRQRSMQRPRR